MIQSWSHSRVVDFEKCKFLAFLKYEKRIPEPPRPLPQGKTEHANDRGTRIHTLAEDYVRGTLSELPHELRHFTHEFEAMQRLYKAGVVSLEGEWGYNREWEAVHWRGAWVDVTGPTSVGRAAKELPEFGRDGDILTVKGRTWMWVPTWLRMKLDALVFLSPHEAIAIDYKTGKKFGNEIKHGEQLMLYQLATFLRYPDLEEVHTELWYLDQDDLTHRKFTRQQGLRFLEAWNRRGTALTDCTSFPANPNKWSCQFCPYGKPENGFTNGTGHCAAGRKS